MLQISRQSINACSSYGKCCKKKNMKKIRLTLKACIMETAWRIQLKFGIGSAPPQADLHRKTCVFLFRDCRATDGWKWHFLYMYSYKIHTCLSCAVGFLGHTTHYRVSWSVSTVCACVCVHIYVTNDPAQINWMIPIQGICMVHWAINCVFLHFYAIMCEIILMLVVVTGYLLKICFIASTLNQLTVPLHNPPILVNERSLLDTCILYII